ncbi:hypothetical protein C0991_006210 [Blastosporella zonata]|nr:hypothetical protein C0991_006210 [Blastosporella zonata]
MAEGQRTWEEIVLDVRLDSPQEEWPEFFIQPPHYHSCAKNNPKNSLNADFSMRRISYDVMHTSKVLRDETARDDLRVLLRRPQDHDAPIEFCNADFGTTTRYESKKII